MRLIPRFLDAAVEPSLPQEAVAEPVCRRTSWFLDVRTWEWETKDLEDDRVQAQGHVWRRLSAELLDEIRPVLRDMQRMSPDSPEIASVAQALKRGGRLLVDEGLAGPLPPEVADALADIRPSTASKPGCACCGSTSFWLSIRGVKVCGICHPPGSKELVREWVDEKGQEKRALAVAQPRERRNQSSIKRK